MKTAVFFVAAALGGGLLAAQEQKPVPKDSVRVFVPGCSKGYVFTAGRRSNRPAREESVRDTEYQGVVNTLRAARAVGFSGRFLYMTAVGGSTRSIARVFLNLFKGNTLRWRERAEGEIRSAGGDYTIIRSGVLVDAPAGEHVIKVSQTPLPLSLRYRIARADVAECFVAALDHPRASRTTFEIVWGHRAPPEPWPQMLDRLQPDLPRDYLP